MPDNASFLNLLNNDRNKALGILYKVARPMAKQLAYKNNLTNDNAEEILQDSVIAFHRNSLKVGFTLSAEYTTYIYSILRYQMLKKHQENKLQGRFIDIDNFPEIETEMEVIDDYTIKEKLLGEMLNRLGEKCIKIIKECYYNKLSMEEIARSNGYANSRVAITSKSRCIDSLRTLFIKNYRHE